MVVDHNNSNAQAHHIHRATELSTECVVRRSTERSVRIHPADKWAGESVHVVSSLLSTTSFCSIHGRIGVYFINLPVLEYPFAVVYHTGSFCENMEDTYVNWMMGRSIAFRFAVHFLACVCV